jgi:hypothetical protein
LSKITKHEPLCFALDEKTATFAADFSQQVRLTPQKSMTAKIYLTKMLHIALLLALASATQAQAIRYSPAYFGPNASPVMPFADASIPQQTTVQLSANYFSGFGGDHTGNGFFVAEIPFMAGRLSLKAWTPFAEYFDLPPSVVAERNVYNGQRSGWSPVGEIYLQTRIGALLEAEYCPAIVLNITLKTASTTPDDFDARRYFDAPGYCFDVELGKSVHLHSDIIDELRGVVNVGFLCWETTGSTQNDAPTYGAKLILSNRVASWENSLAGYYGWMKNGDTPCVITSRFTFKRPASVYFVEYQRGLRDFPYQHFQVGLRLIIPRLTPKF